jgi:hypothetical protein
LDMKHLKSLSKLSPTQVISWLKSSQKTCLMGCCILLYKIVGFFPEKPRSLEIDTAPYIVLMQLQTYLPVFNFASRGEIWPQGWSWPLGVKLSPEVKNHCSPLCSYN